MPASPRINLEPDHVAVIRRNDLLRSVLVADLEDAGYEVTEVDNPRTAIELLGHRRPAVLLLDTTAAPFARPVFAMAALLRPTPSIIGLAPFGHEAAVRHALTLGACYCLRLPVERDDLLDAIRTATALSDRRPPVSSPWEG